MHFTICNGDEVSKVDLCEECAGEQMGAQKGIELGEMLELLKSGKGTPGAMLKELVGDNGRYPLDAYEFVREALADFLESNGRRHASGRGLLQALRELGERFQQSCSADIPVCGFWRLSSRQSATPA